MRRDRRRPSGRHASDDQAPDRSPPREPVSPTVPHHADLFGPAGELSPADVDEESRWRLLEQHREVLFGYVLRLTGGDEADAEYVVKETCYRALQEPSRLAQGAPSVRPWLILLARAVYQDVRRFTPPEPAPKPLSVRRTTVIRAMDHLSHVHRKVLVDLFYRGTSLEEAAEVAGVDVSTVKSRLYYAMRALRMVLDQQVADRPERA